MFDKRHDNILADVRNLDCSVEFRLLNFQESSYINEQGKRQPCVAMTRDGFTFLVMGYRGKKAARFKEAYIQRFNDMEEHIRLLVTARHEFPLVTSQIKILHKEPKPYHFSNECDMLNRIAIGMTAKQCREKYGIPKGMSIRPSLTVDQIAALDVLQKLDYGLLLAVPDISERKRILEEYMRRNYGGPISAEEIAR